MTRPIRIAPDGTVTLAARECDALREVYIVRAVAKRQATTAALLKAWLDGGEGRPQRPRFG